MNYNKEQLRYDEIELSIKNMFNACKRNVKGIVICAIVCGLIFSVLAYGVELKTYKDVQAGMADEDAIEFTVEEEREIKNYLLSKEREEYLQLYKEEAPINNLDWKNAYAGKLFFYIEAEGSEAKSIADVYISLLSNESSYNEFSNSVGFADKTYATEVLKFEKQGEESNVILVSVLAKDENDCKEYLDVAKKMISQKRDGLKNSINSHEVIILQEEITNGKSEQAYTAQKNIIKSLNEIRTDIKTQEITLTDMQKAYIANHLEDNEELLEEIGAKPKLSLLFALIGLFGGVILSVLYICAITIFGGRLQTEKEINKRFALTKLSTLSSNKVDVNDVEVLNIRIKSLLEQFDKNEVALVSTTDVLATEAVICIRESLLKEEVDCKIIENVLTLDAAANQIIGKNVIFVEAVEKSKVNAIYGLASVCDNVKANVIGYICLTN